MSDIVDRLRDYDKCTVGPQEAAAEITRLRAENETLRHDVKTAVMGDSAELADVKRENEKLRAALKQCREALEWDSTYHDGEKWLYIIDGDKANAARTIARAAAAIRDSGE